jgi:BirA family biotin operon repressor/biotin-[acetyl-CoA-carboxylase] ligase
LVQYNSVSSTNFIAATLPAWSAVCSKTQTAGRGRFQRHWIADEGGLWLSAVIPSGTAPAWRLLPLAVGLAVCDAMHDFGVQHLRMRWPNDVLVKDRKLAGLLLDQFAPGRTVAGIGINIHNQPEAHDAALGNKTTRLADLISNPPAVRDVAACVLRHLRETTLLMERDGLASMHSRIQLLWGEPRPVELDLDGTLRRGLFTGVDSEGRLLLCGSSGTLSQYEPHEVRHLTELDQ